ncbi:unnamed protein product [Rotaria sp. Silwood1]|nr:unnamed protein product [Rotaria sp. Silwood1]
MGQILTSNNKTRNDFSLDQLLTTTNNENKESITLIWFDSNIGSNEDTEKTKQTLRLINDYVIFSTDLEQCITFIESINKEKIFLITSGSKASDILPRVSSLRQIDSIFIFSLRKNRYEYLLNDFKKIIGIYIDLDDLCKSLKEQIDLVNRQIQTFSFFDQHQKSTKDLSKESAEFLWFQLFNYVIARLPRNQQAKQQMIQICKDYYHGNTKEIELIHQFEQNYLSKDVLLWYSKQSFIYKLVNKALRTKDIDLLYMFRFFIEDLSKNLQHEHEKILLSNENTLNVYRGVKFDKEEFNKLKENQEKLISTNGYLLTSRRRSLALSFALKSTERINVVSVLFHIQCDIKQTDKNITFADIRQFSAYPEEEEVLFDLNACFQIESMQENESVHIIKMNLSNEGQKITKDYIELTQKETEEISVSIIFGRLLCDLGEYDKSQKYFQYLFNSSQNEDRSWIEFNIGRCLYLKGEWNEAREYYDHAYDRMMMGKPARVKDSARVLNNIGVILDNQGKYDEALDYYQRALKIREEFYPSVHMAIATSLGNIGIILCEQGKYDEALDYHQRALNIQEELYPSGLADIPHSFDNIDGTPCTQREYDKAPNHYHEAEETRKKVYISVHINIATSLNYIGIILRNQRKYNEALEYHQRALKIQQKLYPSSNIRIAYSLNNIGVIFCDQKKYDEALHYYQQTLEIHQKFYPFGHVDIGRILNNIGIILRNQRRYDEALAYHERALEILQKFYPTGHADIAYSFDNIGEIHYHQKKYDFALCVYQQALEIREKCHPSDHVNIAANLNNIGIVLLNQEKYDDALDYHQRALRIREKIHSSGHVKIAHSINNIGAVLCNQKKYNEALVCHRQAFEILQKLYPTGHADIAYSFDNIGDIECRQEKYDVAIYYYQQALKIREQCYPTGHVDIASSFDKIGNIEYRHEN